MLELRHLSYFVAVAEELNFTRAAERLHIGQPSLSAQIKDLEGRVGCRLLDRSTRSVQLTPAGRELLPRAQALLADADLALGRTRAVGSRGLPVRLDIAHDGLDTATRLIEEVLAGGLPRERLDVRANHGAGQLEPLPRGALDVALAIAEDLPGDLEHEVIRLDPVLLAVPHGHRLSGRGELGPDDIRDEVVRCIDPGDDTGWVRFAAREYGAVPVPAGGLGVVANVAALHTAGLLHCVPATAAPLSESVGFTCLPVAGWPAFPWSLVWLRVRADDERVALVRAAGAAAGARHGWLTGAGTPRVDAARSA